MFVQVRGLECIGLGDRRSRVQISAARQKKLRLLAFELVVLAVGVVGTSRIVVGVNEDTVPVSKALPAMLTEVEPFRCGKEDAEPRTGQEVQQSDSGSGPGSGFGSGFGSGSGFWPRFGLWLGSGPGSGFWPRFGFWLR